MTAPPRVPMRERMVATVTDLMAADERVAVVLAGISTDLFAAARRRFPDRVLTLGIHEQSLIGVAAGLAMEGFIPVAHSIAPFLVSRPYEQLKDDFCYQRLGGCFISIGASYDYGTDGMTHHGAEDVPAMRTLPGMRILVPGTAAELDRLLRQTYAGGAPTYYRTGLTENAEDRDVDFGAMAVVRGGSRGTIIAVGPMLDRVLDATRGLDLTVLYCTTVAPFDGETLRRTTTGADVVVVEPYYEGTLVADVAAALADRPARIHAIGVPRRVISEYGDAARHDAAMGLVAPAIRARIERLLNG